jgi:hypothetical protein
MSTIETTAEAKIPRDGEDDYTPDAVEARHAFLRERTGIELEHVPHYSFDPTLTAGNVEQFIGVAQVPIGLAGPLRVNGEHAQGDFYVPLATAEGTLVASYNRGMKLVREAGGVTVTVMDDAMQRAPAFVFESAREARAFGEWLDEHFEEIKQAAETTTRSGKLRDIEKYSASRILYTRFNYTTGDAAGQNLSGKATAAACAWITSTYPGIKHFFLESNFATDKKSSQVNMLRTRGKRVVAEATLPNALIEKHMRTTSEVMFRARWVHLWREQQRRPLGERDHRDLHRHGPGRGECGGVVRGVCVRRGPAERRLLLLGHYPVADRGDLRRRYRAGDAARVPGDARLLRQGQGAQVRGDRGRHRPLRRALTRLGDRRGGMGAGARPAGAQPSLGRFVSRRRG